MKNLITSTHAEDAIIRIYETQDAAGTRYEVSCHAAGHVKSYTTKDHQEARDMYFEWLGQTSFFTQDEDERTCKVCDIPMSEGFVFEESGDTWCSEECLRHHWTPQEQADAYDEDGGGLYWTEWED